MTVSVNSNTPLEASDELLNRWRKIPVAVIVDLNPNLRQISPALRPLRPAGSQPLLFGRAVTAQCNAPDFGAVVHAMDLVNEGDVLVIAANGDCNNAMIGEVLGGHLRDKKAAGVVCDGAIRDVAQISSWDSFPVYFASVTPLGPVSYSEGAVNIPVLIKGSEVIPGDLIIGDDDGLVALSEQDLVTWIDAAEARLVTEANWIKRLAAGETMGSLFNLDN